MRTPHYLWLLALLAPVSVLAAGPEMAPGDSSPILVSYDFEIPEPTGPDTFRLFERQRGSVDLSSSFQVSGERSLRVREGRGDGSFSELLGFLDERRTGSLYVQFYILFVDPEQTFNFALAGPRWFLSFERDGHAFWLATREGTLAHRPAEGWQTLFRPRPFAWYFVDLVMDLDRGRYHLAIYEEGGEKPRVDLRDQRNLADADGSSVAYYSFIGDLEDTGDATIYVDDLLIATDPAVRLRPFVAPGRRRFFVERMSQGATPLAGAALDDLLARGRRYLRDHPAAEAALAEDRARDLELIADQAFFAGDLDLAEELYGRLRGEPAREARLQLKLADVYHLRGDVEAERTARERIYGRLELEELK